VLLKSSAKLSAPSARAFVGRGEVAMPPDRIWDGDPDLRAETERLRQDHRASGSSDSPREFGEWDAGDDDAPIPPRGWLLGQTFCRRFLSSLIGDGGVGKTALRVAQLLSLAIGRPLTGEHVFRRCRVLLVSLEDDRDELRRRVKAAMLHHGIKQEDVRGYLFLAASAGLKLLERAEGSERKGKLEQLLRDVIDRRKIDVVSLDPFVKTHGLEENDNAAMDRVCGLLTKIAIELDIAIDVPHHVSKGQGAAMAGDANRGRGASAFKDAGRLVYTLTPMSKDERDLFGIGEAEARLLVRCDNAKVNIAPPADKARWFRLVGVKLGNQTDDYPNGDEVQTVEPWTPPDMWKDITSTVANEILDRIDNGNEEGQRFSGDTRAGEKRAAWRVVIARVPKLTETQSRKVIASWLTNGVLETRPYHDPATRREENGLFINDAKRPGSTL
jgi:hypothetical protein